MSVSCLRLKGSNHFPVAAPALGAFRLQTILLWNQEAPSIQQNQLSGCHLVFRQFADGIVESESSVYAAFPKSFHDAQSRHREGKKTLGSTQDWYGLTIQPSARLRDLILSYSRRLLESWVCANTSVGETLHTSSVCQLPDRKHTTRDTKKCDPHKHIIKLYKSSGFSVVFCLDWFNYKTKAALLDG